MNLTCAISSAGRSSGFCSRSVRFFHSSRATCRAGASHHQQLPFKLACMLKMPWAAATKKARCHVCFLPEAGSVPPVSWTSETDRFCLIGPLLQCVNRGWHLTDDICDVIPHTVPPKVSLLARQRAELRGGGSLHLRLQQASFFVGQTVRP